MTKMNRRFSFSSDLTGHCWHGILTWFNGLVVTWFRIAITYYSLGELTTLVNGVDIPGHVAKRPGFEVKNVTRSLPSCPDEVLRCKSL